MIKKPIHEGAEPTPPIVLHVPHASTVVPSDVRDEFVLGNEALAEEHRRLVDHFTDELFALPPALATTVVFPVSRFVLDPERFADDANEPMAGRGMGVIYQRTIDGTPLRRPLTPAEREALLARYYRPHHERLTTAVTRAIEANNGCLLLDAHSFASRPLPCDRDQELERPDICVGTDAFHTPAALVDAVVSLCIAQGWTVEIDRPFSGAIVPLPYLHQDARVRAVMIEVNRRLYLDEDSGQKGPAFQECRDRLSRVLHQLAEAEGAAEQMRRLDSAYASTTFIARVADRRLSIKIGQHLPALDDILEEHGAEAWAFITAWNPASETLAPTDNDERQRRLTRDLRRLGVAIYPGRGESADGRWPAEESVLAIGLGEGEAIRVGREYGQNAVVIGSSGSCARLAWCIPRLIV